VVNKWRRLAVYRAWPMMEISASMAPRLAAWVNAYKLCLRTIRLDANALRQTVFLVFWKVVQIQVHLACKVNELGIKPGFIMCTHRYRSGAQRYKAERTP
jgi:hypothetical protein